MSDYRNISIGGVSHSEHKWIWEQANGPVPNGYVVHHKNHDKRDNRLENLQLMTHQEHSQHHNEKHSRVTICVICQTEFTPLPTKRGSTRTCSRECKIAFQAEVATSRYGGPHFINCERCGREKRIPPGRIDKARFCSATCSARRLK